MSKHPGLTLATERLTLRQFRQTDHHAFASILADGDWVRFIGGHRTREQAWRVMATFAGHWQLRGYGPWVLSHRETEQFLGWAGLWYPDGWSCPEIAWTLAPDAVGHGYATEAAAAAREHGFDTLKLPRLISYIAPDNTGSIRVAARLGARQVGTETPTGGDAPVLVFEHQRG